MNISGNNVNTEQDMAALVDELATEFKFNNQQCKNMHNLAKVSCSF